MGDQLVGGAVKAALMQLIGEPAFPRDERGEPATEVVLAPVVAQGPDAYRVDLDLVEVDSADVLEELDREIGWNSDVDRADDFDLMRRLFG